MTAECGRIAFEAAVVLYDGVHPIGVPMRGCIDADSITLRSVAGEASRRWPLAAARVSPRVGRASRFITLPNGHQIEWRDGPWLDRIPTRGRAEVLLSRLESRWWVALAAACAALSFAAFVWLRGLDHAAAFVASYVPLETQQKLGRDTLGHLDRALFAQSRVPPERERAIRARFAALQERLAVPARHELVFRRSDRLGANAAALPGNFVVVTERLVEILSDDELVSVLLHELGHSVLGHTLQGVVREYANAAVLHALKGELAVVGPGALAAERLVQNGYRRDLEREADAFALEALCQQQLSPLEFAGAMERLGQERVESLLQGLLSTHPRPSERAARARAWRCGSSAGR